MKEVNEPDFWNGLYINKSVGWDLKTPTPAFTDLLNSDFFVNRKKLLFLGSGYGYDAVEAAKKGFEVTAVDFSEAAIAFARNMAQKENVMVRFLVEDFFKLSENHFDTYEIIFDYVTFCAIDPDRRAEYSELIFRLLASDGIFVIILFPIEKREGGPPFAVDVEEATKLFSNKLELVISTNEINSIKPRKGREHLQIYRKTNG